MTATYVCARNRTIDADAEPSPGEPIRCQDCEYVAEGERPCDRCVFVPTPTGACICREQS